jgi:hypothetical protein
MKTLIATMLLGLSMITYGQNSNCENVRTLKTLYRTSSGKAVVYHVCDTVKPVSEIDSAKITFEIIESIGDTTEMYVYQEEADTLRAIFLVSDTTSRRVDDNLIRGFSLTYWGYGLVIRTWWGEEKYLDYDKTPLPPEYVIWDYRILKRQ